MNTHFGSLHLCAQSTPPYTYKQAYTHEQASKFMQHMQAFFKAYRVYIAAIAIVGSLVYFIVLPECKRPHIFLLGSKAAELEWLEGIACVYVYACACACVYIHELSKPAELE